MEKETESTTSMLLIYCRGLEDGLEYVSKELERAIDKEDAQMKVNQLLFKLKIMKMNKIDELFLA